ncbi:MAG: SusC/RagA family TonB-linked outer membrane protein, partial [Paludibacteraceae bacterium]|nr:SusC/RagA family TonB-linked outer membrane protein [Paludibacteraceae bacterium]
KLDLMKSKEYAQMLVGYNGTNKEKAAFDRDFNEWLYTYRIGGSKYFPADFDYASQETDWQQEVFNSFAPIQNYALSIDGAGDKYNYSISTSYFNQQGTIKGSDYERFTIRANSAFQIRDWLKVGEGISYVHSGGRNATTNNASPGASILSAALAMAPWDPTRYAAGLKNKQGEDLSGRISASSNFKNVTNPYSMIEMNVPQNKSERFIGDVFVEITPIKGLTIRSQVSMDYIIQRDKTYKYAYEFSSYDKQEKDYIYSLMSRQLHWQVDNTATYAREIGKHSFSAMVGQSVEETNYYSISGSGANLINNSENNWYLKNATEDQTYANDGVGRSRMVSAFGRLFYNYDKRYMATVNFRADASSKFPNNPWGYFPSVSLAWRMSEESWLKKHNDVIDMLKIRLGWGMLGNQDIDSNNFTMNMFTDGPSFVSYVLGVDQQYVNGATILKYVNTSGVWEKTAQWNVGLDFDFWNGMLGGTIEGYVRDTRDLLLFVTSPAHVGNRYYIMDNIGTMRNTGIDLTLTHDNTVGDFHYNINANLSFVRNRLTALNGGDAVKVDNYTVCDLNLPVNTYWGYVYEGIYKTDDEAKAALPNDSNYGAGDAKYKDLNGDGKIDDKDKTSLGCNFPWLTGALTFSCDWKGLDFQIFFQGVYGNKIYNALRERTESTGATNVLSTAMRDVWSEANVNGSIPLPTHSVNFAPSSRFIEDGSYLRLKNLTVGYTLPKKITMKARISRLRFYASANNLLTLTKYTGYDPEVGNHGVDYGNYPQARTFTFGINLDF